MWGRPSIGYMTVGSRTRLLPMSRPLICSVNLVFKPWPIKILIFFRSTFYWGYLSLLLERSLCHDRLRSAYSPFQSSWLLHWPHAVLLWPGLMVLSDMTFSAANFLPMQKMRTSSCVSKGQYHERSPRGDIKPSLYTLFCQLRSISEGHWLYQASVDH